MVGQGSGSASRVARPSRSRPAPSPRASATRALIAHNVPHWIAPGADPRRAAARERVRGRHRAGGTARREHDRDAATDRALGGFEQPDRGVARPGRCHHDALRSEGKRRVQQAAVRPDPRLDQLDASTECRHRPQPPPRPANPIDGDRAIRDHAPERPAVRRLECVERARVHLGHVVGRLDRAGQAHDDAGITQRRSGSRRDRGAQVGRPVVALLVRGAHGARDDDGFWRIEDQVPGERGLLDRVGALDHDDAIDRRIVQCSLRIAGDRQQVVPA